MTQVRIGKGELQVEWQLDSRVTAVYGPPDSGKSLLLECVAEQVAMLDRDSQDVRHALEKRYFISMDDLTPRVFYRLTDNWVELTVRFIVREHGIREVKDAITRAVLQKFDDAAIEVASATLEVVGAPTLRVQNLDAH